MKKIFIFITLIVFMAACTQQQFNQTLNDVLGSSGTPLSKEEVVAGLKEALVKGITNGSAKASILDGYFGNPKIKIPFPPEAVKAENTLRDLGLGNEVDKFVKTLNRGAEEAAKEAKPIFVTAITSMTISDAWGILKGDKNAATEYLKRVTTAQLTAKFQPVVHNALQKVSATKYYGDLATKYNKIPLVKKINPELDDYATGKAIDGLFTLIAEEEAKIRENPLARTTDLLKKVFGQRN